MINTVPLFAQGDPAWGSLTLGNNKPGTIYNLTGFGCLLVSFSMLANESPASVNAAGIRNGLFSFGGGDALTFDVQRWSPGAPYVFAGSGSRHAYDAMPAAELTRFRGFQGPVVLEVNYGKVLKVAKFLQHFVLHVGWVRRGAGPTARDVSLIFDPERGGQVVELCPLYGPTLEIALCRMAYYEPKALAPVGRAAKEATSIAAGEYDPRQRQVLVSRKATLLQEATL